MFGQKGTYTMEEFLKLIDRIIQLVQIRSHRGRPC